MELVTIFNNLFEVCYKMTDTQILVTDRKFKSVSRYLLLELLILKQGNVGSQMWGQTLRALFSKVF